MTTITYTADDIRACLANPHPDFAASLKLAARYDAIKGDSTTTDRKRAQIIDTLRRSYIYDFSDYLDSYAAKPGLTMVEWLHQTLWDLVGA